MTSPDYAAVASLLYPLLALDEFARLCLACRLLQALARGHRAFQAATLGSRILWLARQLDQQQHEYTEHLGTQGTVTMRSSLESHCLALLLNDRQARPWRGADLARLVQIFDRMLRSASAVHEGSFGWQVSLYGLKAQTISLDDRWRILGAQVALQDIRLCWFESGFGWAQQRDYSVLELLNSDAAFAAFQNMCV